jgi:hypothetical protein
MQEGMTIGKRYPRRSDSGLTDMELVKLVRVAFDGIARITTDRLAHSLLLSLQRFRLVEYVQVLQNDVHNGYGFTITDEGKALLTLRRYKDAEYCCEHAIRLPCVCSRKVFCPDPDHAQYNGCHGSHD